MSKISPDPAERAADAIEAHRSAMDHHEPWARIHYMANIIREEFAKEPPRYDCPMCGKECTTEYNELSAWHKVLPETRRGRVTSREGGASDA